MHLHEKCVEFDICCFFSGYDNEYDNEHDNDMNMIMRKGVILGSKLVVGYIEFWGMIDIQLTLPHLKIWASCVV